MSDQRAGSARAEPAYPPPDFPLVFADNVSNFAVGQGLVRLYLVRTDPSFDDGIAEGKIQQIAQLVMPLEGFVATTLFFGNILRTLIEQGVITQARIDEIRQAPAAQG